MDEDLISKKDLLEQTGISYGQLYRWKRKNLIPEDWFIRKSTFTGQETFFPRERILERIKKIQAMKEKLSLDALAEMFAPGGGKRISRADILKRGIASDFVLNFYIEQTQAQEQAFPFEEVLAIFLLEKLLHGGEISLEEGKMLVGLLQDAEKSFATEGTNVWLIRKFGVSTCFLTKKAEDILFDREAKVIVSLDLMELSAELKGKWL
ncbi:DUF4004 family protein [Heyndrickxia coagulans]|uniref:YhbD family protein n=1 Tax=Heyndrickxia coagulans TaxID=1398 RepID=UPI000D730857|nr:YhbD family protein [Heyndrickxia coagulans]AWP36202.1 DUF4004 domain-containing protein [Heyndrickxia coagulans]QDI61705.1 DUF4004 family protein [Heyndrickxia coagulans]